MRKCWLLPSKTALCHLLKCSGRALSSEDIELLWHEAVAKYERAGRFGQSSTAGGGPDRDLYHARMIAHLRAQQDPSRYVQRAFDEMVSRQIAPNSQSHRLLILMQDADSFF